MNTTFGFENAACANAAIARIRESFGKDMPSDTASVRRIHGKPSSPAQVKWDFLAQSHHRPGLCEFAVFTSNLDPDRFKTQGYEHELQLAKAMVEMITLSQTA